MPLNWGEGADAANVCEHGPSCTHSLGLSNPGRIGAERIKLSLLGPESWVFGWSLPISSFVDLGEFPSTKVPSCGCVRRCVRREAVRDATSLSALMQDPFNIDASILCDRG
eukprot:4667620-Amphidinium_carterae.1